MAETKEVKEKSLERLVKDTRVSLLKLIVSDGTRNTFDSFAENLKNMNDERSSYILTLYTEKKHGISQIDHLNEKDAFLSAARQLMKEIVEVDRHTEEKELKHVLEMLSYLRAYNDVKGALYYPATSNLI